MATVRRIFGEFTDGGRGLEQIAEDLNRDGVLSPGGGAWDPEKVRRILTNVMSTGTLVYNKTTQKLKTPTRRNPRGEWVVTPEAFAPLVDGEAFARAQALLAQPRLNFTPEVMLEHLSRLLEDHGLLRPALLRADGAAPSAANLATQGYLEADVGLPKAEATARLCVRLNSTIAIDPVIGRFRRSQPELGNVIFCCVDSIETRRLIWAAVRDQVTLFVDGRMSAEAIRVLTAADEPTRRHYATTFFAGREAFQGACTARSTIYTANLAAGFMLTQFTRHLRQQPVDADVRPNLLSMELTVTTPPVAEA